MAKTSLEKDKERFAEWRAHKQAGERSPDELWKMASLNIPTLGLNRVAQEFHLDFARLREKAKQFGVVWPEARRNSVAAATGMTFQELPLNGMLAAAHSVPCLVLERPDGLRLRIEGQLPDADYVSKLAACLWK
jgi:hypothetical protein